MSAMRDGRTGLVDDGRADRVSRPRPWPVPEPDRAARGVAVGILVAVLGFWLPVAVAVARWWAR